MTTKMPPPSISAGLPVHNRGQVEEWWRQLPEEAKAELVGLWDARMDDAALAPDYSGTSAEWHSLPIRLEGGLVDEETRREDRMLKQQLFDYIVNHEEVKFCLEEHHYHICRAHKAARAVIRDGLLPMPTRQWQGLPNASGASRRTRQVGGVRVPMTEPMTKRLKPDYDEHRQRLDTRKLTQ